MFFFSQPREWQIILKTVGIERGGERGGRGVREKENTARTESRSEKDPIRKRLVPAGPRGAKRERGRSLNDSRQWDEGLNWKDRHPCSRDGWVKETKHGSSSERGVLSNTFLDLRNKIYGHFADQGSEETAVRYSSARTTNKTEAGFGRFPW